MKNTHKSKRIGKKMPKRGIPKAFWINYTRFEDGEINLPTLAKESGIPVMSAEILHGGLSQSTESERKAIIQNALISFDDTCANGGK